MRRTGLNYFPCMRFCIACLFLVGALMRPLEGQTCPASRMALVLSGGGAKGLAHIGVLRAMDSLGVRPDLIVGTSMGAIIGGLYASGYSARQIDSLARNLPLSNLFRTYEPRVPITLGNLQPLVVWEQESSGLVFQRAAVLEPEVNALLNAGFLRGNLRARGNFDSLPIPFRAVATDLLTGQPVVFARGDLAQSVRASAAIPLLFEPERINGRYLGDGGLSANVPIAVAREAGADRVIVSYTTERVPDSLDLQSTFVLIDHLIGNLFRQPQDTLNAGDLPIRPDVEGFRSLNFSSAAISALIAHGFEAGWQRLNEATCLPRASRQLRPQSPPVLSGVSVAPGSDGGSSMLARLLDLRVGDTIDVPALQQRMRQLGNAEQYASVWLNPQGTRDSITFRLEPHPGPTRILAVGAVYDNDLGGRVWLGQVERGALGGHVETTAAAFLGERRQELYLGLRLSSLAHAALVPALELRGSRELVRRFEDGDEQSPIKVHEAVSFTGIEINWAGNWHSSLGVEARLWDEPGKTGRSSIGPRLVMSKAGRKAESLFLLQASANEDYRRLEIEGIATIHFGRLQVRPRARWGVGETLPEHQQFVFGGADGFAGLHIGELRSERELSGSLIFLYPVRGQLFLRVEPMAGASGGTSGLFPESDLVTGIRAGFDLATGLGPIRVEYGVSEGGRDGLLVRIGRWF